MDIFGRGTNLKNHRYNNIHGWYDKYWGKWQLLTNVWMWYNAPFVEYLYQKDTYK